MALLTTASSLLPLPGRADGGGVVLSPYGKNEVPTAQQVAKWKSESNRTKSAAGYDSDGQGYCSRVKFAYIKAGSAKLAPLYALTGVQEDGKKAKIELSVLNRLTVRKVDAEKSRILCEVEVFPTLTPAQLVKEQPGFSALDSRYKQTVRLWIGLGSAQSGLLHLVGSSSPSQEGNDVRVPFDRLPLDRPVQFNPLRPELKNTYWWAIPSVTDDSKYPNRLRSKE
jgi:hypothetical protein